MVDTPAATRKVAAMKEAVLNAHRLNLGYTQKLVADIPDDQMCAQPVPGRAVNHAAFLLGHLAWVNDSVASQLAGAAPQLSDWKEVYGMGAKPGTDRSCYRSKAELLQVLEDSHRRLAEAFSNATPEVLAQPAPERMRGRFRTVGDVAVGMMTIHHGTHNGQMSAWRRALGWPAV